MHIGSRAARRVVAALLALLAACGDATGPGGGLSAARARWAQRGPTSYTVTVLRGCECLPEMTGPVVIIVRDGAVVSRTYVATGAPVASPLAEQFPSVEQMFARIVAARRADVARLQVVYDPALGHPVRVSIDPDAMVVDDEVTYQLSELRAL